MRRVLFGGAVLAIALITQSPAHACINDGGTHIQEQQFKSSYLEPQPETASLSIHRLGPTVPYIAGGAGAMLVAGGIALGFLRPRRFVP